MSEEILKKTKNASLFDDYLALITANCEKTMVFPSKLEKVNNDKISIPTINNYNTVLHYNYSIPQLKSILKCYKLKIGGNKSELLTRLYSHLHFSAQIIKIQKVFRSKLVRTYFKLHGPAAFNRSLCTNSDDFITMDPLEELSFHQFLSYKDLDGFIYGFNVASLFNLFVKSKNGEKVQNPYNRNVIPESIILDIRKIIRLSVIIKIPINLCYEDETASISNEKAIELRALSLFQKINELGNYSDFKWFLSLNKNKLIRFVRELADIWNYRAQIELQVKRNICPPNGDPFRNLNMQYITSETNLCNIQKVILEVLEKLVNNGVDKDSKALGACYVLGSLTIVNDDAATSLPWLFQSFSPF
jgi:hypothetical protein